MHGAAIIAALAVPLSLAADAINREAMIANYCVACHNTRAKTGGLALEGLSANDPAVRPDVWEKVVRKVTAGEMPPGGMPNPGENALKAFAAALVNDLDAAARRKPYAGRAVVRRLNRTEYANAIADLLGIELLVAADLPQDGIAAGFDNIADALSMSP